ncbi:MAG TPA: hypothetical protein VFU22_27120 [Roseiflexaceae bacterium]|nr:hypothetical protein [Roseiflexaceae bacterium]
MLQQHTQSAEIQIPSPQTSKNLRALLGPRAALSRMYTANRSLTLLGVLMLIALLISLVGLLVDPRTIAGAPAWLKPFKFALSIAIYSFTLQWILGFVQGRRFLVRMISFLSLLGFMVEMIAIITQALRGTISHFNAATAFDTALFSAMGSFVLLLWAMNLVAAGLLLFQRLPDPALAWALRLGLLLTLVGGASGFLMTTPTPAQRAAMAAGQPVSIVGAHSVGVADGGPGLPIAGWSTVGGDLRVGHFVGLHALQALPIIGWLLARRRARQLGNGRRVALVWIAGLGYLGLIGLLIWQALRGQPLLAPDATTLAALALLVGAVALAAGAIVATGRGRALAIDG